MSPRRKARKEEQLTGELSGDLATYEKFGLFQRAISKRTAYRYRGVLLLYQKFLAGDSPSLEASKLFLAHLRKHGYGPSTLRIYRAALKEYSLEVTNTHFVTSLHFRGVIYRKNHGKLNGSLTKPVAD